MSIYIINSKKNGKQYGIRFRVNESGEVVHKNLSPFKTQAEAKRAQFDYIARIEKENVLKNLTCDDPKLKFIDLLEKYKLFAIDNLSPVSIYDYFNIIDLYIYPAFRDMLVAEMTKRVLTDFQDSISRDYSYKYKSKIRTVLSSIFTYAVNRDYIELNPVARVEKIRNTKPIQRMLFWTKAEFDKFITVVDNPTYKALFTFLYLSGCRKGEAFGLVKEKINYNTNMVLIDTSFNKRGKIVAEKYGKKIVPKTKNKKTGEIYMPANSLALIKEQLTVDGQYVFGGKNPLPATTVTTHFNNYIAQSGVKKIRLHDLRHSCAALFISLSGSELNVLYAIAERLRDSVEQILKTYGHLFPSRQAEIIKTLDKLF